MGKTCASCGSAHASNAAYCAHCGHSLKSSASAKKSAKSGNNRAWRMPVAIIVGLLALGALYFWLFIADDLQKSADMPATEAPDGARPDAQIFFAMTDANIRDKPTPPAALSGQIAAWFAGYRDGSDDFWRECRMVGIIRR